jgi:hypothetical protein
MQIVAGIRISSLLEEPFKAQNDALASYTYTLVSLDTPQQPQRHCPGYLSANCANYLVCKKEAFI